MESFLGFDSESTAVVVEVCAFVISPTHFGACDWLEGAVLFPDRFVPSRLPRPRPLDFDRCISKKDLNIRGK